MLSITVSLFFHLFLIFFTFFIFKRIIVNDLFKIVDFERKRIKNLKKKIEKNSKEYFEIENKKIIEIFDVKTKIFNFFDKYKFSKYSFDKKSEEKIKKNVIESFKINNHKEEDFYEKGDLIAKKIFLKIDKEKIND